MLGASRESLATVRRSLTERLGSAAGLDTLADELFAVARLLGREKALRGLLSDAGTGSERKAALVTSLLTGKVGAATLEVVNEAVTARWSSGRDLVDSVEILGFQTVFTAAEAAGDLDTVEDELFRFGRTVQAEAGLRALLTDLSVTGEAKTAVLRDLLAAKARPATVRLLEQVVTDPRGRKIEDSIARLVELAAERRQRLTAEVRVAAPLEAAQERRLTDSLGRLYSRDIQLHVVVDPTVLGGAVVRVGDEVLDGSIVRRLEQVRQRLVA